jgi:DNA gyrase subunit A
MKVVPISLEEEMKSAYIDYSMSVIVSRALPDVRDGLKPVHRRVLFGMNELGVPYNKAHKKSARIVGEVLGKYHPHGDSSVYDTMVRMAQDWSLRYPLVDGQGNFGSMDGDSPAAMRYTEARLTRIADELLGDIEKDTVDFSYNFDDTLLEPTVLPSKLPNLLVNGAAGIAVGMATNMLPHNLSEVAEGVIAAVRKPDISIAELMEHIKAPDFPTGGTIYGTSGVKEAFETGRGRVVVRGKAEIDVKDSGKETIIITEIPYQVNKAMLVMKIADLVNEKKIEGISDIRDESDRNGLRIVVEIKRDAMASVVLSHLYKYTPLQTSFGINNIALVNGRPELLNLKQLIGHFIDFRLEVITRRTRYELRKALEKAHILIGFLIALDYLDEVIALIRASRTPEEAKAGLMRGDFIKDKNAFWEKFAPLVLMQQMEDEEAEVGPGKDFVLSEIQAKAILDMRLQKLTGLERDKVRADFDELQKEIERLRAILDSEEMRRDIVVAETTEIKERFGDGRRTEITPDEGDISIEDMIVDEDVIITISHFGYIKRTKASEYRKQARGGKGSRGAKTRDEDFVEQIFSASTHNYLLLFTESGRCHWLRVYEIPEASKTSSGRMINNILALPKEDKIRAYIRIEDLTDEKFINNNYIVFCTKNGTIKKTEVEAFSRPRQNGINAITINEGDQLLEAKLTNGNSEIIIASREGRAIRFNESNVRSMGRTAAGVRGIDLEGGNEAIGMVTVDADDTETSILVISEKGLGKRSALEDYRITSRGGKGVRTLLITEKTGALMAIKAVKEEDDLMIINKSGISIRLAVRELRVMGRATQGVRVIDLGEEDEIADVALLTLSEGEDLNGPDDTAEAINIQAEA